MIDHEVHDPRAPSPAAVAHLKASDAAGLAWFFGGLLLSALGIWLSLQPGWLPWSAGQLILTAALVQWFVILHECGHGMLFRRRLFNNLAGQVAGFFAAIPFNAWKRIHDRHHKWTGWQDVDPTTAALAPRPLSRFERVLVNTCWRFWIPLFALTYRATNFWNVPRLWKLFPRAELRWRILLNVAVLAAAYAAIVYALGWSGFLRTAGLALLLSLVIEEILLISQHTHVPMTLSHGEPVDPYSPIEQQPFTRSLLLPRWASAFLLHFDAHELHHMYPFVPGYQLARIGYSPGNEVRWWRWIPAARAVPGEVFFFQNRDGSGFDV